MGEQGITLLGADYSVYTRIARLALIEKQVPFCFRHFNIYDQTTWPDHYREFHPFAKIPTLVHDGRPIIETGAITRYVDRALDGPALQPSDLQTLSLCDSIIGMNDAYGFPALIKGVYVERISKPARGEATNEDMVARSLEIAGQYMQRLEKLLADGDWFCGEQLTLADIHSYPMIRYFWLERSGQEMIEAHPRILDWMERFSSRTSAKETIPPAEQG